MEEYNWADFGPPAADNQVSYYLRDYFSLGELTKDLQYILCIGCESCFDWLRFPKSG